MYNNGGKKMKFSLKEAKKITQYHLANDHLDSAEYYRNKKFTNTEVLAISVINYCNNYNNQSIINKLKDNGVIIKKLKDDLYKIKYKSDTVNFKMLKDKILPDIDQIFIKNKCHLNCARACSMIKDDGYVYTSEIAAVNLDKDIASKILHSYIVINNLVYDLTQGIVMSQRDYNLLFNVDVLAKTPMRTVRADINSKLLDKIYRIDDSISLVEYYLAHDECVELVDQNENILNY